MHEVHETLSSGAVLYGRYLIVDLLGKGGFSAVYLVKDLQGEESFFALKEAISDQRNSSDHFSFEYSLLERLSHPALPRVHHVFDNEERNRLYMLMDYVEGPNLETLRQIQHEQRFSLAAITPILAPVVDAIAYLHQQDPPIVHRDIKPSNMIVPVVEKKTVLVDFGIAKEYDQQGTTSAVRYGSHGYGAPEQYSAGTNTRTDIYGLGATLYTLLTGEVPADALERMTQVSNDQPDPLKPACELNPSIPAPASVAIGQALSINMRQRFATVGEFWQAVQGVQGEPIQLPQLVSQAPTAKTVSVSAHAISARTGEAPAHSPHVKQEVDTRSRKSSLLLILLVFMLGAGIGASYLGYTVLRGTQGARQTSGQSSASSGPAGRTPGAHATATATGPSQPKSYPHLAASYQGNIDDLQANVPSEMKLTGILQDNATISGTFIALHMREPFQAFLDTAKHISFYVAYSADKGQLSFTGAVQKDGSLQGQFCEVDQGNQCIPSGIFGLWRVAPVQEKTTEGTLSQTALVERR